MTTRVLFLTESREDYLADSLLHGLISLGLDVVDYPRKDILYAANKASLATANLQVRGHGFTLYGLLSDSNVDRSYVIQRLEAGLFDLVIIGQIWRQWGQLLDLAPFLQSIPVVILDGDDDTRLFHRSKTRLRRYGWQPFPIPSYNCLYFKRECYAIPGQLKHCQLAPASFSIPAEKIQPLQPDNKKQYIASHCVDAEVASACGLRTQYAFATEDAYYSNLQHSFYAITTKRGGWDCLRHYEIAAAGSLLCFRQLESKPSTCAPHHLVPGVNCLSYQNWPDLKQQLDSLDSDPVHYRRLLTASRDWIKQHTTTASAQRLLDLALSL